MHPADPAALSLPVHEKAGLMQFLSALSRLHPSEIQNMKIRWAETHPEFDILNLCWKEFPPFFGGFYFPVE